MTDPLADDGELVFRLGYGDTTAARDLYVRHGAALLRFGLAMTASRHVAEDMVHDTFLEVLQNPRGFDPARGSVVSYLYGVARHRLSRLIRSGLHTLDSPAPEPITGEELNGAPVGDELSSLNAAPAAEEEIDRALLIARVRQAILDLPFVQREVLALCDLEELTYATVAVILDCPIGTVRSRLHRARGLLATRLTSLGIVPYSVARCASAEAECEGQSGSPTSHSMELSCKGTVM